MLIIISTQLHKRCSILLQSIIIIIFFILNFITYSFNT